MTSNILIQEIITLMQTQKICTTLPAMQIRYTRLPKKQQLIALVTITLFWASIRHLSQRKLIIRTKQDKKMQTTDYKYSICPFS